MNRQLQAAVNAISKLPDSEQTAIANRILDELSEQEWTSIVSKPRVQKRLLELADEAMSDEVEEGGFDNQ